MAKVLNYAGTSRVKGVLTFRTASDDKRFMQLIKLGDTDVHFAKINPVETKAQAAKELLTMGFANGDAEVEALLTSKVVDENPFAKKPARVAKPKTVKVKSAKPRLIIGSVSVGTDDPPYTPKQAAKIRAEFMKKLKVAYEAN